MSKMFRNVAPALVVAIGVLPQGAAAASRVWISAAKGVDNGTCGPIATPCRTLSQAHANVDPGGEIDVLDPGGYGSVVITKSVNIVNEGVGVAGALASAGDAITVNAGSSDTVLIRGFVIENGGSATNGVNALSVGNLAVQHCLISGFGGAGIALAPLAPPAGANIAFTISDTVLRRNATGIALQTSPSDPTSRAPNLWGRSIISRRAGTRPACRSPPRFRVVAVRHHQGTPT